MSQKQHVELHRKIQMRRHLLRFSTPGAAYVPFIGDGDLAAELYCGRRILGADVDRQRIEVACRRLGPDSDVIVADCDQWPFAGLHDYNPIAVADFDAYSYPYASFRAFWAEASLAPRVGVSLAPRVVLFFTDGQRQSMMRVGSWLDPEGNRRLEEDLRTRQRLFNSYLAGTIWPWFEDFVAPWRVVERFRYLRGWMVYWGAVIERG